MRPEPGGGKDCSVKSRAIELDGIAKHVHEGLPVPFLKVTL
jgi:hypothetical protein